MLLRGGERGRSAAHPFARWLPLASRRARPLSLAHAARSTRALAHASPPTTHYTRTQEFFSELREVDRDNEVNRVLWAFKLNPYEKLNARFDATPEEVRKAFRKASLAVHPDKCKHAQAADAFEGE